MEPPLTSTDTTAQLVTLFFRVAKRLHRHALGQLASVDMTPSQGRALREITDSAVPLRIADLAGRLDIAPRSATEVVDALESNGLVTRRPNPADRRTLLLAPTALGEQLCARFAALTREAGRHLFSDLSDAEQHQLLRLLTKVDDRP